MPEIYSFANNDNSSLLSSLISSPVHLSDDVMISLRSGNYIRLSGIPAFNKSDLAQPSTGWAAPYIYWAITAIAPQNLGVLLFALIGFCFVLFTLITILVFTNNLFLSSLFIGLLTITNTNSLYALNGWDHLYQTFFLVFGLCLTLKARLEPKTILFISLSITLGTFCRLDGLPIALAILLIALFRSRKKREVIIFGIFPFIVSIFGAIFAANAKFGNYLPTTTRLKLGASPSIEYAFWYLFKNSIFTFSVTVLFLILIVWGVSNHANQPRIEYLILFPATLFTGGIAFLNSDYFQGGRMYWLPTLILIAFFSCSNSLGSQDRENVDSLFGFKTFLRNSFQKNIQKRFITYTLISVLLIASFCPNPKLLINKMIIDTEEEISISQTAKFYVATDWINANLLPGDGAIGLFYAGMAFHLMKFDTADFLGKADELIARSDQKWGPPGHNKWDISATLQKWNPQAIIPSGSLFDPTTKLALKDAVKEINLKSDFGFAPSLIVNRDIRANYSWCRVAMSYNNFRLSEGIFLRKDISQVHQSAFECKDFPKE